MSRNAYTATARTIFSTTAISGTSRPARDITRRRGGEAWRMIARTSLAPALHPRHPKPVRGENDEHSRARTSRVLARGTAAATTLVPHVPRMDAALAGAADRPARPTRPHRARRAGGPGGDRLVLRRRA